MMVFFNYGMADDPEVPIPELEPYRADFMISVETKGRKVGTDEVMRALKDGILEWTQIEVEI
jgi:hypothetical protein